MQVCEVMTRQVETVAPDASLQQAAMAMEAMGVGSLPVCQGRRLVGTLTDRDIVVRGVASGLGAETGCVSDAMSSEALCCSPEQDIAEALRLMGERQVRRLPVVDADKRLVGIVALGDLALERPQAVGPTVSDISEPTAAVNRPRSGAAVPPPRS